MDIKSATLILSDDDGTNGAIHQMDVIEHNGSYWLVPEWLDNIDQGITMPVRIVLLDVIPHSKPDHPGNPFVVSGPVPKSVFEGRCPPELNNQYLVHEKPKIILKIPSVH